MKKLTELTALFLGVMTLSGVFAACTVVEDKDSLNLYSEEFYLSRTGEPEEKAKRIQDEISRSPLKKAGEIKLVPITKSDGTPVADEFYFYRNALKDDEKKAYDITRTALLNGKGEVSITVPLPVKDAQKVYKSVLYDGADIFYAKQDLKILCHENNEYATSGLEMDLYDFNEEYDLLQKNLIKTLSKPLSDMWGLKSDYDKVKYAHDYLTEKLTYDSDYEYSQSLYGAFTDGKADYMGYAHAFQYLMQKSGVPCAYVSGENHAWNVVLLDGEYYAVDVSLDDLDNVYPETPYRFTYQFFNVTDDFLKGTKIHEKSVVSRCIPEAEGTKFALNIRFDDERFGTDFDNIEGTMPETSDTDSPDWWGAEITPWNRINRAWTESDWNDEGNGVYSKYLPDVKRTYYWYSGNDTYYCIHDASKVLYVINPEKQSMAYKTNDYTKLPPPDESTVTEPVTEETTVTEAVTSAEESDDGWWNTLDNSWNKSDWVSEEDGIWRIYDSWNEVNYYWVEEDKAYYADFSQNGEKKILMLKKGSSEWVEVE